MPTNDNRFIFFKSAALADDALWVSKLSGREEISQPFRFDLELLSKEVDLDPSALLASSAQLVIKQGIELSDGSYGLQNLRLDGVIASCEQREEGHDWVSYLVEFRPHLWRLSLAQHSRIFLDKTVQEIVDEVLQEAGFASDDAVWRTNARSYVPREFTVQYQEADLAFIQRLCEHEGIAYWFEHSEEGTTVVFGDGPEAALPIAGPAELAYRPQSQAEGRVTAKEDGASAWYQQEVISSWRSRHRAVPAQVVLKDYNYRTPDVVLDVEQDIPADAGYGSVYAFGEHFKDEDTGRVYARIRAEEIACTQHRFFADSDCRSIRAGATLTLAEHYRDSFNQEYLIIRTEHEASQEIELESGGSQLSTYRNSFEALPAEIVYRPPRITPKPRVSGTINAHVDASSESEYAELDDQGRYKVVIPYDRSGRSGGQASRFMRMAQPYAGNGMGMHFPLHVGTEVLLGHVNGDPDRPIILGAVPNPTTASPVAGSNQTQCAIATGGGSGLVFEDRAGGQRVALSCPHEGSSITIGDAP